MSDMSCSCMRENEYTESTRPCYICQDEYMVKRIKGSGKSDARGSDYRLADMERLFKALADATRLRILGLLLTGEVCVCHIHESPKIRQPKASRHLAYLRRAGLVEARRDGLWMHYRMAALGDPIVAAIGDTVRHPL